DRLASLPARDQARKLLGWDAQSTVVLAVARLSAEKGIDLLAPLANRSNVRVVVAGDGPLRGKLETMNIEFLGARNDVPLLMAAADIVVVPSRSEGLGLVAIEAAAAGRPVVATRTGGLPEVVEDQWTGLLVPPDNPEAIVDAVESLRVNPDLCARLGDRARQRALRCFSRESMWHATDRVYKRILQP
ncbi:MAG: glycosyltransferase, partial [Armatimonadaceae bacterium]